MGRQIATIMTLSDAHGFIAAIAELGGVELVQRRSDSHRPKVIEQTKVRTDVEGDQLFYAFVHKDHVADIVMEEVPAQGYWEMNTLFSPVVEFTLSFHAHDGIRPGRLWYEKRFYDANGDLASKPALFLEWAERAFRMTRSRLKKFGDYRCGPEAYGALQSGRLQII